MHRNDMSSMDKKVLILGGSTYDIIIHLESLPGPIPQTIHKAPSHEGCGSTGAGKALPLTYLGVPNTLYTAFGNDWYGGQIEQFLLDKGINLVKIIDPAGTQRHVNIMDNQGNRISMFITQSSEKLPHDKELIESLLEQADIVVINIIPYCKQLIPWVKESGKPVWTDLHDYDGSNPYHQPFIELAKYIQFSSDNLPYYRPQMEAWIDQGKDLVVCTHGRQGASLLAGDGTWLEVPAHTVDELVDSNGAGDSFFSGFLFGWLQGKPWDVCLQYGTRCGALAVMDTQLAYRNLTPGLLGLAKDKE